MAIKIFFIIVHDIVWNLLKFPELHEIFDEHM